MNKDTKRLTQVLGAIGIAAGLGLGAAGIAAAATGTSSPASSAPASKGAETGQDQQDPQLNGSIHVPEQQGTNDVAEAQALQAAAKITPDQAKQAALAAVPGTVNKVELDNENGSVVYSVEVTANGTATDVKVDAGNGTVLARESTEPGGTNETGNEKAGTEKADTETPAASGATR